MKKVGNRHGETSGRETHVKGTGRGKSWNEKNGDLKRSRKTYHCSVLDEGEQMGVRQQEMYLEGEVGAEVQGLDW